MRGLPDVRFAHARPRVRPTAEQRHRGQGHGDSRAGLAAMRDEPARPFAFRRMVAMHDETYKTLFAFPRMVEDLLRGFVGGAWIEQLDFATLEKLSADYVSDELRTRHGDTVWRVRHRGHRGAWLHVLVLLEFQSTSDPDMALRILAYTTLLYQDLARTKALAPDGRRPPVLPVVLYNGARPWTAAREVRELIAPVGPDLAPYQPSQRYVVLDERRTAADDVPDDNLMAAVIGLEQSREPADLVRVVDALRARLREPGDAGLRRAFTDWIGRLAARLASAGAALPPMPTLEDVRMTLIERVSEWPAEWLRKGHAQGLEQGREHERALLRRMAASRFGAEVAEHLAGVLARTADPDRLVEIGDWLVRCETGDEFLARVTEPGAGAG